jgi:putative copper export protein
MPILCSAAYCTGVTPSQAALRRLRGLAWLEMAIGVAVLTVASALATSAPPMRM